MKLLRLNIHLCSVLRKKEILSCASLHTLTSSLSKNLRSDPAEGRDDVVVKSRREREEVGVSMLERHA